MQRLLFVFILSCCALTHCSALPFDSDDDDGLCLLQHKSMRHRTGVKRSSSALFVAGLEGSGHHLWLDLVQALDQIKSDTGNLPFQVKKAWIPGRFTESGLVRQVSWECESKWDHKDLDLGVHLFQAIADPIGHHLPGDYDEETIWITPKSCLSYPCGMGTHEQRRDDFFPRVDWLAEAAADVPHVDLHVGYLYRPLEELLSSNCIHRQQDYFKNETCDSYVEILISNAVALLEQLNTLGTMPRSKAPVVQCLRYGDMESYRKGLSVLFNHKMSFESILGQIWNPHTTPNMNGDHHYDDDPRDLIPNWDELVESLRVYDAELLAACEVAESYLGGKPGKLKWASQPGGGWSL